MRTASGCFPRISRPATPYDFWWVVHPDAGLQDIRIHDARHTYAPRSLNGVGLTTVGRLPGTAGVPSPPPKSTSTMPRYRERQRRWPPASPAPWAFRPSLRPCRLKRRSSVRSTRSPQAFVRCTDHWIARRRNTNRKNPPGAACSSYGAARLTCPGNSARTTAARSVIGFRIHDDEDTHR